MHKHRDLLCQHEQSKNHNIEWLSVARAKSAALFNSNKKHSIGKGEINAMLCNKNIARKQRTEKFK
jgi:hypothetical protein